MALLPPEPEAGSPGDALRWSGEARTPALHSKTHNCFLSLLMRLFSPRKEVCEAPTFLPSHQTCTRPPTPSTAAFAVDPCLHTSIPTGPWEALALHPPHPLPLHPTPADQGRPPSLLLAAQRVGAALSQVSTMDICHQGRPTVVTESP